MKLVAWVVTHIHPLTDPANPASGVTTYVLFQQDAPTLESALEQLEGLNAEWKGPRPVQPELGEDGLPIVEGEADEVDDTNPNAGVQWTEAEDPNHHLHVAGPFATPVVHDTYRVTRPGATLAPVVIAQGYSKSAVRTEVNRRFGHCPGTKVVRMLANQTRIISPIL